MARHRLKDEELLHPRRVRASQTTGQQLDIPTPKKSEIKRWKFLVDACVKACLKTDRRDNILPKQKVRVLFKDYSARPAWFPTGRLVKEDEQGKLVEYSCDLLLLKMWQNKLAPYNPNMLYEKQRKFKMNLTKLTNSIETELDNMDGFLYNDGNDEESGDESCN